MDSSVESLSVTIIDDTVLESSPEKFTISLSGSTTDSSTVEVRIRDEEIIVLNAGMTNYTMIAGEDFDICVNFNLDRSRATSFAVDFSVGLQTRALRPTPGNEATVGEDYVDPSTRFDFEKGGLVVNDPTGGLPDPNCTSVDTKPSGLSKQFGLLIARGHILNSISIYDPEQDINIPTNLPITVTMPNNPPDVANPILDQDAKVGSTFMFTVPEDTFSDQEFEEWKSSGESTGTLATVMEYSATKADDSPLPDWLTFTPASRSFSGTPSLNDLDDAGGTLTVKVSASDGMDSSSDEFDIRIAEGICRRTPEVRDAILGAVSPTACGEVTSSHLSGITSLDVSGNANLTTLSSNDFSGLSSLTELQLNNNSLSTLPADILDGLIDPSPGISTSNLIKLHLNNNSLSALPETIFNKSILLTELHLNNNSLSTLPVGIFSTLGSLTELHLNNNSLSSLPVGIFNLGSLTELHLNNNSLSSLPVGIFSNLSSLTKLHLNNNSLSSLPAGIFSNLGSLTELHLNNNSLSSLPADIFNRLLVLTELHLNNNSLSSLPATIFNSLSNLEYLSLNNNQLTQILPSTFSGLDNIKSLNLDNNNFMAEVQLSANQITININEDESSYTIVLLSPPSDDVEFSFSSSNELVASASGSLTFVPASGEGRDLYDWNIPKSVTVTANTYNGRATISHVVRSNSDTNYNDIDVGDVTVVVNGKTDPPTGVLLADEENLETNESGNTATFQVVLGSEPTQDVTVTLTSSDPGEGTVSGPLTFTPSNWESTQSVTVTGVDDTEADGDQTYQITFSVSSSDAWTTTALR